MGGSILLGSPPPTRGIHQRGSEQVRRPRITPAYAGNTEKFASIQGIGGDHPRLRGEYALKKRQTIKGQGSPPPTRGIRKFRKILRSLTGITPAYAGNTCVGGGIRTAGWDHPRLRGEYLNRFKVKSPLSGSPPPTRGILEAIKAKITPLRITPAYAGNTIVAARIKRSC